MKNSIKLASLVIGGLLSFNAMSKEVIRLSTYVNESDIRYEGFKKFAEIAEEKSNGNLKVRIYPSSTLHGWSEGVDAVQGGVADISWISADNRLSCYRTTSLYPSAVDLSGQLAMDSKYRQLQLRFQFSVKRSHHHESVNVEGHNETLCRDSETKSV